MIERDILPSRFGALPLWRAGDGPALVLLHGGAGSWTHWTRNIPALAERHTACALDLPGCGDAPDVARDTTIEDYVTGLAEALAHLVEPRGAIRLCGFSFGAAIAAGAARQLGGAVSHLALLGPGGFGAPRNRPLDLRPVPFETGSDAEIERALRHNLGVMMLADPAHADAATIALHRENVRRARYDSRRVSLSEITLQSLPHIAAPTLVAWGEKDNLAHPSVDARAKTCRALKPAVRVHRIAGAGHWVQYEAADEVNRLLLDFFTQDRMGTG